MRRTVYSLVIVAVASVACARVSRLSAGQDIVVSGEVETTPQVGPNPLQVLRYGPYFLGSFCDLSANGLLNPAVGESFLQPPFDDGGHYSFSMVGSDTQATSSTRGPLARCLRLRYAPISGSPSTEVDFSVQSTSVTLPAANLWHANVQITPAATAAQARWEAVSALVNGATPQQTVTLSAGSDALWQGSLSPDARSWNFPLYWLDDRPATFALSASVDAAPFGLRFNSETAAVPVQGMAAPSHGAACDYDGVAHGYPCPLTDGKSDIASVNAKSITLHLYAAVAAQHLLLRRYVGGGFTVEASVDGVVFTPVGEVQTGAWFIDVPLTTTLPAKTYRVSALSGGTLSALAEVVLAP